MMVPDYAAGSAGGGIPSQKLIIGAVVILGLVLVFRAWSGAKKMEAFQGGMTDRTSMRQSGRNTRQSARLDYKSTKQENKQELKMDQQDYKQDLKTCKTVCRWKFFGAKSRCLDDCAKNSGLYE